jgi:hypothetical protein
MLGLWQFLALGDPMANVIFYNLRQFDIGCCAVLVMAYPTDEQVRAIADENFVFWAPFYEHQIRVLTWLFWIR